MTDSLYVIVQAGGRGSRLRHHTWNKPKCLVSVQGKPILYHLFDSFPQANFIIIGDYLYDQLATYLNINAPLVNYQLIQTQQKGTLAGIRSAAMLVPSQSSVIVSWSDLIINDPLAFDCTDTPVLVTTDAFTCRWSLDDLGNLREVPSSSRGIPGIFYFPNPCALLDLPSSGEFVKWFSHHVSEFQTRNVDHIQEFGDFAAIEQDNDRTSFCRFFNKVDIDVSAGQVIKQVVDPEYQHLYRNEIAWYQDVSALGFRRIPNIFSQSPLTMQYLPGVHAYQAHDYSQREKTAVIADHLDALTALHDLGQQPANIGDLHDVYVAKTQRRVDSVRGLLPLIHKKSITVNGKKCRNIFADPHQQIITTIEDQLAVDIFTPIHGDPTFSNTIVDDKLRSWFIDPRGYFSKPGIYGDAWYDYAKVYYSAVGGYDLFNRRKFKLHVDEDTVEVLMDVPAFADTARSLFKEYFPRDQARIRLIHGLIWLSMSGYVTDDIDSVIGAFYLGLYWIEDGLQAL